MQRLDVTGVRLAGVVACLPKKRVDNLEACTTLLGDAPKAAAIVKATGIRTRTIAEKGTTSLDLCVAAAEALLTRLNVAREAIGGIVSVSITPAHVMPGNACVAQARLGLPQDVVAFDLNHACSGYCAGLYLAGTLARTLSKPILLLDGDVQSAVVAQDDTAVVPVLADAGTATLIVPDLQAHTWSFAFLTQGEAQPAALTLSHAGTIKMDGFAVYRFVAAQVTNFLRQALECFGVNAQTLACFVPHQANVYMIRQLARSIGFSESQLCVSGDVYGNAASASVPVTLVHAKKCGRLLLAGFGGGLSATAGLVTLDAKASLFEMTLP